VFGSSTPGSAPEDVDKEALKAQQTLKRLLAEINKLLEATKRFIKDTNTSSPDEATHD
jgi:hypothetical protein